jgi:hypothetical protein
MYEMYYQEGKSLVKVAIKIKDSLSYVLQINQVNCFEKRFGNSKKVWFG